MIFYLHAINMLWGSFYKNSLILICSFNLNLDSMTILHKCLLLFQKLENWAKFENGELHVVCRLLSLLKMCRKGDNFHSVTMTCLFVKQTLWQCKHRLPLPCIDQIHRPGPLEFSCPCSVGWGTSCGAVRGWPETDKITGVISLSIVLFAATLALVCFGTV